MLNEYNTPFCNNPVVLHILFPLFKHTYSLSLSSGQTDPVSYCDTEIVLIVDARASRHDYVQRMYTPLSWPISVPPVRVWLSIHYVQRMYTPLSWPISVPPVRVWLSIHGGNLGAFDSAHSFLDDISALEYTGSLGSHRGEPQESISASLNFVSKEILAEIICDHAVNCSHSHLSCSVLEANSNRVLAHLLTYSIQVYLANCLICFVSPNVSSSKVHNNVSIE